jgi:hypothetical protein
MGDAVERGLECQKTMDGKESKSNGLQNEIPSCCLKAMASAPELEANCHSTVVSGWFSASQTRSGHYQLFKFIFLFVFPHFHSTHNNLLFHCVASSFYREIWGSCLFQQPNVARWLLFMHMQLFMLRVLLPCEIGVGVFLPSDLW